MPTEVFVLICCHWAAFLGSNQAPLSLLVCYKPLVDYMLSQLARAFCIVLT